MGSTRVGEMRSGEDGLTGQVNRRLRAVRIRSRRMLGMHVGMTVAVMMMDARVRTGTIVINNAPCGSEDDNSPGCHQYLERFLACGYSLTVSGTTAAGQPFSYVCIGKGPDVYDAG